MNIRLLKKWRTIANKLFFKDFTIEFDRLIKIKFPKLRTWKDYQDNAYITNCVDWIEFFGDEKICAKDLRPKLQKSYEDFIYGYLEYMILKTKKKHPYKRFKIRFFRTKRR